MDCKRTRELVMTDYIDGNMGGDALAEVERHVSSCADCRKALDDLLSARKGFAGIKTENPSPAVWNRIASEINAGLVRPGLAERLIEAAEGVLTRFRPVTAVATAIALVLLILSATLLITGRDTPVGMPAGQDDIITITSMGQAIDEEEPGFGTGMEQLFL